MRRLLIVAPTFFPNPAVSSIRATELCRHLPAFGWEPVVVTRSYGFRDGMPGVATHFLDAPSTPAKPGRAAALRKWLIDTRAVSSLVVPDLSIRFWGQQLARIEAIARVEGVDAIFTTSPTHSIHAAGVHLQERLGLPWIADFRDPYTTDARFRPSGLGVLRRGAHRRYEAEIHARATRITYALPSHLRWARRAYPQATGRQMLLRNGFPQRLAQRDPAAQRRGRIAVIGSGGDAEVLQLARAIDRLRRERGLSLELRHCGRPLATAPEISALLGDAAVLRGRVPHDEALREMAEADVLVACHAWALERSHAVASRLYEYLATGVPVIAINPLRGDRPLLRRWSHVQRLYTPSPDAIANGIEQALACRVDPVEVARFRASFGREAQARLLAAELDAIVRPTEPAAEAPGRIFG